MKWVGSWNRFGNELGSVRSKAAIMGSGEFEPFLLLIQASNLETCAYGSIGGQRTDVSRPQIKIASSPDMDFLTYRVFSEVG